MHWKFLYMLNLIEKFLEIQGLLLAETPTDFVRDAHNLIDWESRLIGIVGARGVGKTTILLQRMISTQSKEPNMLYLSADSVLLGQSSLFELAQTYHLQKGGKILFIDEVHKCKNWSAELKTIHDSLPNLKVVFSGSSQINILKSRADLARRAALYTIPGLSFREYLSLEHQIRIPVLTVDDIVVSHQEIAGDISKDANILPFFQNYLKSGYYPFYLETRKSVDYFKRILNSIDKTIFEDIALVENLQTENLIVFKELLEFLSSITPGEINIHKIAKNIGKKDDTIKKYLQIMHNTSLLRFLPNSLSGHAKLKAAEKIYFDNTNILNAFSYFTGRAPEVGLIRETFAVEQLQSSGLVPLYSKIGDISVGETIFEIGGASKTNQQLANTKKSYVLSDQTLVGIGNKIPLYLLGLLY